MTRHLRSLVVVLAALSVVGLVTERGEAHKAVTSQYTYNDDVFPILRTHCTPCHAAGGVAPMSLMTYDDAFPWGESMRGAIIAEHMPPWNAQQGFGAFTHAETLTPHEVDVLLTWVTGGTPLGALGQTLPAVPLQNDWPLGTPDLALPLPSAFTLTADTVEDTREFTLETGAKAVRWVRAVDLRPGTPSIVRSALIYVKDVSNPTAAAAPERVLARWVPGQHAESIEGGAAIRLAAGAEIGVRVHYRKTWQFEGKAVTDRSTVGVYFAQTSEPRELLTLPLASRAAPAAAAKNRTLAFSRTLDRDVLALAIAPDQVPPNISLQVEAALPDGSRAPIIRLNTRADWNRRYWFAEPIALPKGTTVQVVATFDDPDLMSAAFGSSPSAKPGAAIAPLRLALDFVPAVATPAAP